MINQKIILRTITFIVLNLTVNITILNRLDAQPISKNEPTIHAGTELTRAGKTISNGIVSVTKSDIYGGAVVSYKFHTTEFIDIHDLGRMLQISTYGKEWKDFETDGYHFDIQKRKVINPNEAGDAKRNASKVLWVKTEGDTSVASECVPREWFTHSWPGMDDNNGAAYAKSTILSRITFLPEYQKKVSRLDFIFTPPVDGMWHCELPALYMLPQFCLFYGYDAEKDFITSSFENPTKSYRYKPSSKIGGVIATTLQNGKSIGVYGAGRSKGGDLSDTYVGLFCSFPASKCTKLGNETVEEFLKGGSKTNYKTYIVVGNSPTDVKNTMRKMYLDGMR